MKADDTAEKRLACPIVSVARDMLAVITRIYYQGGVEVTMVPFAKALVVFDRLFSELFVEARSRVRLLLREGRFDGGGQVVTN